MWSSHSPLISRYRSATPSLRISSFSTTRRLALLRGMIEIWMRWRCSSSNANLATRTTASGVYPFPACRSSIQ